MYHSKKTRKMLRNQHEYELNLDPGYVAHSLDDFDSFGKQHIHTKETRTHYQVHYVVRAYLWIVDAHANPFPRRYAAVLRYTIILYSGTVLFYKPCRHRPHTEEARHTNVMTAGIYVCTTGRCILVVGLSFHEYVRTTDTVVYLRIAALFG